MKFAKEIRNSSTRSGNQVLNSIIHMMENYDNSDFLYEFNEKIKSKETPGTYPVTLAVGAVCLGIPLESITRMLLYSFSSSIVSAAIRLGLIQHLDAQKILKLLAEPINKLILTNEEKNFEDIWQLTPITENLSDEPRNVTNQGCLSHNYGCFICNLQKKLICQSLESEAQLALEKHGS